MNATEARREKEVNPKNRYEKTKNRRRKMGGMTGLTGSAKRFRTTLEHFDY